MPTQSNSIIPKIKTAKELSVGELFSIGSGNSTYYALYLGKVDLSYPHCCRPFGGSPSYLKADNTEVVSYGSEWYIHTDTKGAIASTFTTGAVYLDDILYIEVSFAQPPLPPKKPGEGERRGLASIHRMLNVNDYSLNMRDYNLRVISIKKWKLYLSEHDYLKDEDSYIVKWGK